MSNTLIAVSGQKKKKKKKRVKYSICLQTKFLNNLRIFKVLSSVEYYMFFFTSKCHFFLHSTKTGVRNQRVLCDRVLWL